MSKPSSASEKNPNALFLSPESPYPTIGGGPLRSASLLEYLAQTHSVHAVVFSELGSSDPSRSFPEGRVDKLDLLHLPYHSKRPLARLFRNSLRLILARPPLLDRFSGFESAIASLLTGRNYDVAVIEHFWCAPYVAQIRTHAKRVILDLHNIESRWHESLAAHSTSARAFALRRFAAASHRLEQKWLRCFDAILVPSTQEADWVRKISPVEVMVYPNSLPIIPPPQREEREEIVFSGNLEYLPNIEAIHFFHDRIWPALRRRPQLKWRIIGKNPGALRDFLRGDPNIELTGPVENAVAELACAQVAVVPVLSGSGTRVKILEAWAAGTAVVSTRTGAEGLSSRPGEHLLLADAPEDFARAVTTLLDSESERGRIGAAGRQLYEQSYTWPAAWKQLGSLFGNASLAK